MISFILAGNFKRKITYRINIALLTIEVLLYL